ncbi:MAG: ketose-bisphosphate aldolase [Crocinitomicaceae bacterium]
MNGTELLAVAKANNFAIPAFNISDWAMFKGVIEISEKLNAPVIIAIHPDELSHTGDDIMPSIIQRCHKSSVPTIVHFDHGTTYEQCIWAIQAGFTSIMIDGSLLPFEENMAITKKVVDAAHAVGISVEGELGTIGQNDSYGEKGAAEIIFTDPSDAVTFIKTTGVDSLAVAIGTSHGLYPAGLTPKLEIELLKDIKKRVSVPLVLHGGSGNPDTEIAQGVANGINKINISSDIKVAYHDKMREILSNPKLREPNAIQPEAVEAMKITAAHKIKLFKADGKASLY